MAVADTSTDTDTYIIANTITDTGTYTDTDTVAEQCNMHPDTYT